MRLTLPLGFTQWPLFDSKEKFKF